MSIDRDAVRAGRAGEELRAVDLAECCRRIGISYRTGERLIAEGRFPIPSLPGLSTGLKRPLRRFSTHEIDLYLREASVDDARPQRRQMRVAGRGR
jgi:hypothetical protein